MDKPYRCIIGCNFTTNIFKRHNCLSHICTRCNTIIASELYETGDIEDYNYKKEHILKNNKHYEKCPNCGAKFKFTDFRT